MGKLFLKLARLFGGDIIKFLAHQIHRAVKGDVTQHAVRGFFYELGRQVSREAGGKTNKVLWELTETTLQELSKTAVDQFNRGLDADD